MSERKDIKQRFHDGKYQVVCNVGTLTTGVDWDVRCLILARPTKSEMLYVQIIGRCLRTADGKDKAIILDHTDTTMRLGFASDIHHDHLNGGRFDQCAKVIRKPVAPQAVPQCACLIPVGVEVCPACGFERVFVSGYTNAKASWWSSLVASARRATGRPTRTPRWRRSGSTPSSRAMRLTKGYQPGWAFYKYKEKFNVEPSWAMKSIPAMAPARKSRPGSRHTQIQWARSKKNPNMPTDTPDANESRRLSFWRCDYTYTARRRLDKRVIRPLSRGPLWLETRNLLRGNGFAEAEIAT